MQQKKRKTTNNLRTCIYISRHIFACACKYHSFIFLYLNRVEILNRGKEEKIRQKKPTCVCLHELHACSACKTKPRTFLSFLLLVLCEVSLELICLFIYLVYFLSPFKSQRVHLCYACAYRNSINSLLIYEYYIFILFF